MLRLAAADTVVFLDLPVRVCLWRVVRRFLAYRGRSRPDLCSGCAEKLDAAFLWWICTYGKTRRPAILGRCGSQQRIVVLRSAREIACFLPQLRAARGHELQ